MLISRITKTKLIKHHPSSDVQPPQIMPLAQPPLLTKSSAPKILLSNKSIEETPLVHIPLIQNKANTER